MAGRAATSPIETIERIEVGGRALAYVLRRSPRARGLRLTIDARRGLVVSMPPPTRRGWANPNGRVEGFIREREAWVLRHLGRLERERAEVERLGGAIDGGSVVYLGAPHRVRVVAAVPGRTRRSTVERVGADDGDELVVTLRSGERRTLARILETWFRERGAVAIERAVSAYAPALGAVPSRVALRDPRTRWGSASRDGRLMFSWRLILAPPASLETVVVHELAHLRLMGHGPKFWRLVERLRPDHRSDRAWLRRNSHLLHAALDSATVRP
jgi:predicted metal-dependent hydrolase